MEKNIDELKKKVLELCDTIDKQNDERLICLKK